ncbi:MAG: PAS domain S-box protein [candidate division Zixibacteria bacterium]|nr:PAS domain S-box protein [candidate division Zixibacteria bacterium]
MKDTDYNTFNSIQNYRSVLENLREIVFQVNASGELIYLNPAWTEISGWQLEDSLGHKMFEFIHPEERAFFHAQCDRLINSDIERCGYEVRILGSDGDYHHLELCARPVIDDMQNISGIVGNLHDITERKTAGGELEQRLEFERLVSTISSRFINLDLEQIDREIHYGLEIIGHFLRINWCFIMLIGSDRRSMSIPHEWCSSGIDSRIAGIRNITFSEKIWWYEILAASKNIQIDDINNLPQEAERQKARLHDLGVKSLLSVPMIYGGRLKGALIFGMIRKKKTWDPYTIGLLRTLGEIITSALERKKSIQALRESESRYQELFNAVIEGLGFVDDKEIIRLCNPAFARIFEFDSSQDLIGRSILDFIPEELQDFIHIQSELRRKNKSSQYEIQIQTCKQNEKSILVSVSPQFDSRGSFIGSFANLVDVTERRHLEEQLESTTKAAEAANKAKSTFLANMSHELRTPLNSIIGFADLLWNGTVGEINDTQKEYLEIISQSGLNLMEMINDLLDLAKIEAGRVEVKNEKVDLGGLLARSIDTVKSMVIKKKLELESNLEDAGYVWGDEQKVRQIVYNLLSNAIKFTSEGGKIGIDVWERGDNVGISVWDTGIGISAENQKLIFEEFKQVEGSYTRKFRGTGLGLALCKSFVELLGGRIWVESEEGKGSRFSFMLPRKRNKSADTIIA